MILKELRLKNFKKYKDRTFVFQKGLIAIIGKNGSGKSTILQAFVFALFGILPNTKKELIKNSSSLNEDELLVSLKFIFKKQLYEIRRFFKGKALKAYSELYLQNELILIGSSEVSLYISKLLKIDKEGFLNTIFASQKELTSLTSLPILDRKKIIRKFLGLEKIDKIQKNLKEKLKDSNKELLFLQNFLLKQEENLKMQESLQALENLQKKLKKEEKENNLALIQILQEKENLQENLAKQENLKEQKNQNEIKLEQIKIKLTFLNEQENSLLFEKNQNEKLKLVFKDLQNTKEKLEENSKQISKQKEAKNKLEEKFFLLEQIKQIKKQSEVFLLKDYENLIKKDEEKQKIELKKIKQKQDEIKNLEQNLAKNESQIFLKEQASLQAKEKLNKLLSLPKALCPTCFQELGENFDKLKQDLLKQSKQEFPKLKEQKKILLEQIKQAKLQKEKFLKQEENLQNKLAQNKVAQALQEEKKKQILKEQKEEKEIEFKLEKYENINFDESKYQLLCEEQKLLVKDYEKYIQIKAKLENEQIIKEKLSKIKKQKQILKQDLKLLQSLKFDFDEENFLVLKQDLKLLEQNLQFLNEEKNKINTQILLACKDEENLKQNFLQAKQRQENYEKAKLENADLQKLDNLFLSFKNSLSAQIIPRLSLLVSQLLSKVTKMRYEKLYIDEDFDFFVYDKGEKYPISRFSGGEIDLFALVLRVSLAQVMKEFAFSSFKFLAFDEVLASFDEQRKEEVLEVFYSISKEYEQIFLISHDESLKDSFENLIEL